MSFPISSLVLYVKDIPRVSTFYQEHFGYKAEPSLLPGWQVLVNREGGCGIALQQAAKSQKSGAAIKIVFAVRDVEAFISERKQRGLIFGSIHQADGYCFSNAKDPAGNSISISDRLYQIKFA